MPEPSYLQHTRTAYDTVAHDYAEILRTDLVRKPCDRAVLAAFAELVIAADVGPVLDVGCGPGLVTAHLHHLGVDVTGVDISPVMIEVACRDHPDLRFEVGSMKALIRDNASLGGLVAWYSIIHTPPEDLPMTFDEFRRVLAPGGQLLLAFQVGDERRHLEHAYGHAVSLDAYRLSPTRIVDQLREAGLSAYATLQRDPDSSERVPQGFIVARPTTGESTPAR
jgi:ubiquinone/menaquinone biosynthesis C-methylase UbiE